MKLILKSFTRVAESWSSEGLKLLQLWQQQQQILKEVFTKAFESHKATISAQFGVVAPHDWKLLSDSIHVVGRYGDPSAGYSAEITSKKSGVRLVLQLNSDFSIKEIRHLYD